MLHACPVLPAQTGEAFPAPDGASRACPECLTRVPAASLRIFCSPAHKAAFHNRQTVRGRRLVPLQIAARVTRNGSRGDVATGKQASREANRLLLEWVDEDRAAGRMSMVDYVALTFRLGVRDR